MTPYDEQLARRLWLRFELVHDVVYFSRTVIDRAAALGLRGYWMGYFALRSAPLGPVGPAVVGAAFYGFHPTRVRRALPDAWTYTTPAAALAARLDGVAAALGDLGLDPAGLDAAAELAWRAAQGADPAGRPLAAANQALARPDSAAATLWQATAVLREHRGDGHVAALVSRGIRPVEAHWLKMAAAESDPQSLETSRGFPTDEWEAGRAAVQARGWVDADGTLTAAGRAEHAAVEAATDLAAAQPWTALGRTEAERLLGLLDPIAAAVVDSGVLPATNPVGLPLADFVNDRLP